MNHTEYIKIREENTRLLEAYQAHNTVANSEAYMKHCADKLAPALTAMIKTETQPSWMQQQLDDNLITAEEWSQVVD